MHLTAKAFHSFVSLFGIGPIRRVLFWAVPVLLLPLTVWAQPTIDGDVTDGAYSTLSTRFSDQISSPTDYSGEGLVRVRGFRGTDSLFVAVEGKVRIDDSDAFREIMVWLNVTDGGPSGIPQGDPLPVGDDGSSPFSATNGMIMDMETDYAWRNTGSGTAGEDKGTISFIDYVNLNMDGTAPDQAEGDVSADGTPLVGSATAGRHALLDRADLSTADADDVGWEFAIPFSAIGASSTGQFQLFVAYGNPDGENMDFSAHIMPDDGISTTYDPDQDWTSVDKTQATGSDILPIELASFEAHRDGRDVTLNWSTTSETNNSGFVVQRALESSSFRKIGWVDGAGTITQAQSYRFTAEDLSVGTHRFRLRQVDLDGRSRLSDVVTVEIQPDGPVAIDFGGTNPVTSNTPLAITPRESGPVSVTLYDALGRRVETLHRGRLSANQTKHLTVDASFLSVGTYFLRVKAGAFTETKQISVVR